MVIIRRAAARVGRRPAGTILFRRGLCCVAYWRRRGRRWCLQGLGRSVIVCITPPRERRYPRRELPQVEDRLQKGSRCSRSRQEAWRGRGHLTSCSWWHDRLGAKTDIREQRNHGHYTRAAGLGMDGILGPGLGAAPRTGTCPAAALTHRCRARL